VNISFLTGVKATTDIIWSAIESGMSVAQAMKTYAGISSLSTQEKDAISTCKSDLGIADVLNARAGVTWGWGACEGAEHTPTQVQVFATGPGAAAFNGTFENTRIGQLLLQAVA
jgi:alkaline phosphatase